MTALRQVSGTDKDAIFAALTTILSDITSDWELDYLDPISLDTELVSHLGFESIDIVMLLSEIQTHFKKADMPFEDLLVTGGEYVTDLRVGDLVNFIHANLTGEST